MINYTSSVPTSPILLKFCIRYFVSCGKLFIVFERRNTYNIQTRFRHILIQDNFQAVFVDETIPRWLFHYKDSIMKIRLSQKYVFLWREFNPENTVFILRRFLGVVGWGVLY